MRVASFWLLAIIAAEVHAAQTPCPCGYTVKLSTQTDHAVFTDTLETNFVHGNLSWNLAQDQWVPQAYNVTAAAARGPYGKAAQVANAVMNKGSEVHAIDLLGEPGLQLWVRRLPIENGTDLLLPMAEVVSNRSDILYGSFRAGMKTTSVNGTCAAFFFYHNDHQEIDMESLSKQQVGPGQWPLNLVNQSPDPNNTNSKRAYNLSFSPSEGYHEYRFDWLPDRIDYFVDSEYLMSFTDNIPDSPGAIHLSHWSNGDPNWSAGPPKYDAILVVQWVKAYFNSTDPSRQDAAQKTCDLAMRQSINQKRNLYCPILPGEPQTVTLPTSSGSGNPPVETVHHHSSGAAKTQKFVFPDLRKLDDNQKTAISLLLGYLVLLQALDPIGIAPPIFVMITMVALYRVPA